MECRSRQKPSGAVRFSVIEEVERPTESFSLVRPASVQLHDSTARQVHGWWPHPTLVVYALTLLLSLAYAVFFSWLSLQRYDAFLMHALDMGNMDQAVWNTLHGHLFSFTNMRAQIPMEAFGTTTRLSFHVEPILLPFSLVYLIHAGPPTLIIAQALIVAFGTPAAARLALRVTGSATLALAAAIAYLLSPSLEAATLYEFHPVTLAAPFLLWAIVFAEERLYVPYAICAVAAMACKEEIGLIVAVLGLWLLWRGADRRVALASMIVGVGWSFVALEVVIPHFAGGPSAYYQRYLTTGCNAPAGGAKGVVRCWVQHPAVLWQVLTGAPKWSFLHRQFITTGYLCLLSLPTLLISLPSLAIIMFSSDQHMYGGLGHYSAELVPIEIAAAIYGVAWLMRMRENLTPLTRSIAKTKWKRLYLPAGAVPIGCALWLALMAGLNGHANGFTPLAASYSVPVVNAHDQLGTRLLALIPPDVPVSAQDELNPHLGERNGIYLFPDVGDAQYVALDVTTNVNPGTAAQQHDAAMGLLASRHWRILAADDGYLILRREAHALPAAPTLPPSFYSFVLPITVLPVTQPLLTFGDALSLIQVSTERREQVNLRVPDVILHTTWRVLRPLPASLRIRILLTNTRDVATNHFDDWAAMDWAPPNTWRVGQTVEMQSRQIAIVAGSSGTVDCACWYQKRRRVDKTAFLRQDY